jgi:hypothetical protein
MGQDAYPQAEEFLIPANGGGSNGSRSRLWKVELQRLADELQLAMTVCHFPPGASKWNKMDDLNLEKDGFHGEWNYTICPN